MGLTCIIKKLPEEFEGQFTYLGGNIEKHITFSQELIKKENKSQKPLSYRLQFIDSTRFMASSISNLVNNLAEEIHKIKYKYRHDVKRCEVCGAKHKDLRLLSWIKFKDNLTEYKLFTLQ